MTETNRPQSVNPASTGGPAQNPVNSPSSPSSPSKKSGTQTDGNRAARRQNKPASGIMPEGTGPWLIIGLGNPGEKYARTRHSVGQIAVRELVNRMGAKLSRTRFSAQVAQGRLGVGPAGVPGAQVIVGICETYMNVSGGPVNALAKYYKIDPKTRLLIIHDELDLAPGTLRLKYAGSEAGHNGLKSVTQATGSRNYARLRIGVGRPTNSYQDIADYVLQSLNATAYGQLENSAVMAADLVEDLVNKGFLATQQVWHSRT